MLGGGGGGNIEVLSSMAAAEDVGIPEDIILRGRAMPLAECSESGLRAAGEVRYEISCRHLRWFNKSRPNVQGKERTV